MLEAIFAISQGKPHEEAMQSLHTQISSLMEDLGKDRDALTWFNLSTDTSVDSSTPPLPEPPSTPAAAGICKCLPLPWSVAFVKHLGTTV